LDKQSYIIFVLENFYPDHRAGTETYVYNLAKGLQKLNYKVAIIIAAVGKNANNYIYNEIPIYALSVPLKISVHELNGLQNPSNLTEFTELIKALKPDLVHFHSFSRSFTHFHIKTAFELGCKTIFTAHLGGIFCARGDLRLFGKTQCDGKIQAFRCSACYASVKHSKFKSFAGAAAASLISKTNLISKVPSFNLIANKKQSMEYLANYTHKCIAIAFWIEKAFKINRIPQTTVITQAIDTSVFTRKLSRANNEKLQIGFIGRLNPSKGLHLLMKALELDNLYNRISLEVIAIPDSSELQYASEQQNRFKALNFTKWFENKTHAELNEIMENWDLLVLPSTANEVAPLVILEAFAKGIPVLGSSYPAIAEMIDEGKNGYIFETGNVENLAKKLAYILENKNKVHKMSLTIEKPKSVLELVEEHNTLYNSIK